MRILILILSALIAGVVCKVRFDGFKVYRVVPREVKHLEELRSLQNSNMGYSFWTDSVAIGRDVDIMVPPQSQESFEERLKANNYDYRCIMNDVQKNIDLGMPKGKSLTFGWTDYHPLSEIYNWLHELEEEFPGIVKVVKGGSTYEGRDILGARVSFNAENENHAVFIEGGTHAKEWISPATVTYILNEILRSTDPDVRKMANGYDWYIFPSFNPDGYAYTFEHDRLWRKTRTPYGLCYGADPNRNWDMDWNKGGTSNDTCHDQYPGIGPFSEVETKTLSEYLDTIGHKLFAYLAFHSYSQYILIPYSLTNQHLENFEETYQLGLEAAESLSKRYGTQYTVGNWAETMYVASGVSVDWVKDRFHTRLAYTYELRDKGFHAFLLPPEQIIPTAEETLDAVVTMLLRYSNN